MLLNAPLHFPNYKNDLAQQFVKQVHSQFAQWKRAMMGNVIQDFTTIIGSTNVINM
jgi:hypothetical protein